MKKTNNREIQINPVLNVFAKTISILLIISMTIIFIYLIKNNLVYKDYIENTTEENAIEVDSYYVSIFGFMASPLLVGYGVVYIIIMSYVFFYNLGTITAKIRYLRNQYYLKKNNPYIYYRDLPNNFGVGITSILIDSTIENEKDIISVILDLCAKGYLKLVIDSNSNYNVTIIKDIDDNLLQNEKYIINSIKDGTIKNFNYSRWYDLCTTDAVNFGLIDTGISHKKIKEFNYKRLIHRVYIIIAIICAAIFFIVGIFLPNRNERRNRNNFKGN